LTVAPSPIQTARDCHLDCSRAYIGKLEAEGVIQRQGGGFPRNQSRIAYLRYLRRERRQSPRSDADAAHAAAKTEMLQRRLIKKKRELLRRADFDEAIETACERLGGAVLQRSGGAAQHRRRGYEVRKKMAKAALAMSGQQGEPPPEQQQ
jgi:hypothetical protein